MSVVDGQTVPAGFDAFQGQVLLTGLKPGTTYTYQVLASNLAGSATTLSNQFTTSAASAQNPVPVGATEPPTLPSSPARYLPGLLLRSPLDGG
jgi:hypothetical protein